MSAPTTHFKTESGKDVYGLIAEFKDPAAISHAAEKVRDAGYRKWDVYSPFPIHGMEEAMGLPASKLPLVVAAVGLTMACVGFGFQYFVSGVDYPLVHQGKPPEAWQTLVPVTFEIGVLFTAFASLIGMMAFNALPRWHHPLMCKERFLRTSDDRFIIAIEAKDPKFDPAATRAMLDSAGAIAVEIVEE
ncbi:MAG: DUF3341 domain-containing protein [Phycisphaerales bacterium]